MSPKFQIYKESDGKIRFRILSNSNQVIAAGEACAAHDDCLKGIEDVQRNCNVAIEDLTVEDCPVIPNPKFEVYTDSSGLFRFRLKDAEGKLIAQGEGYGSKDGCLESVEVVKSCLDALVDDPFATEVVLNVEIPKIPAITVKEAPAPTPEPETPPTPVEAPVTTPEPVAPAITIRIGEPEAPKQKPYGVEALPVFSMLTILGLELAVGFTKGIFKAATSAAETANKSGLPYIVTEQKGF